MPASDQNLTGSAIGSERYVLHRIVEQPLATPAHDAPGSSLKGETTIEEPDRAERALGRRSAEIRATVPDLEMAVEADGDALLRAARVHGCSTTAVLVGACAAALRRFPRANASYRDGRYELHGRVNVGVTVSGPGVPPVATLLDADTKTPAELDDELQRLRDRARAGELTPPEQAGATFTFSDAGEYGIDRLAPLVTPPQAAAVAAGAVRAVPVVRDGAVTAGHALTLTLACDHRILFGDQAAGFLAAIAAHVERRI